jgi:hypothetical protein
VPPPPPAPAVELEPDDPVIPEEPGPPAIGVSADVPQPTTAVIKPLKTSTNEPIHRAFKCRKPFLGRFAGQGNSPQDAFGVVNVRPGLNQRDERFSH